ncbi:tRNA (5-methylaminomethyl-2-thiouridine)(34)-methyltransferase MnmD [Crocinitomix sp.]|nr:tRNA (5-methylaminomethyl-2-thiouridine)(34)-methyltransferase MnmD [Crocinitomix sp.]
MDRRIIVTEDKSKTLLIPALNETYHSTHGAKNEAMHVFIAAGLHQIQPNKEKIRILEMGFGTGLNAILTIQEAQSEIHYTTIEKYPLPLETIADLDYTELLNDPELSKAFNLLHESNWNSEIRINPLFQFKKIEGDLKSIQLEDKTYDLIYYDAFGPRVQPNLWTESIFKKLYETLDKNGVLVTYCAQGQFKRNLKAVGFDTEALPGPPGKREMTRAIKR